MARATLKPFAVALRTRAADGTVSLGFLGTEPDGPLLAPCYEIDPAKPVPDDAVPKAAAWFTFYAGTTGADEARIPRRRHELAGGLGLYLDLQGGADAAWRRMNETAQEQAPESVLKAVDEDGQRDTVPLSNWMRFGCPELYGGWDEITGTLYRIRMVARMEALIVTAPTAYLPIPDLTFVAHERWDALLQAYAVAVERYAKEKAQPSAG